jgi:hypothetical protein
MDVPHGHAHLTISGALTGATNAPAARGTADPRTRRIATEKTVRIWNLQQILKEGK